MKSNKSILILFIGIIASIGNFLYGFLINRSEIHEISDCDRTSVQCRYSPYRRIVLLLVDSLKYEFIDPKLTKKGNYYRGYVDVIDELIKKQPRHVFVSHFVSDPPTTTLQRIKALTTGSLPTFVDIGSNFGSSELVEDNIISQWNRSNYDVKFVGDDTWTDLFPNKFNISESYPSFNIKDLDSVDRKVEEFFMKHLSEPTTGTNQRPEIIIGHTLGIDHCGHTFGRNHSQMARKLTELNDFIKKIIPLIDKESIFIMFGDHGMTSSGDHGGDSTEEIDAGLLVVSGKPLSLINRYTTIKSNKSRAVSQIDLVPTLAAVSGVAIPFSNLGIVIPDLLTSLSRAQFYIDLNIQQVSKYINYYEEKFGGLEFPKSIEEFLKNSTKISDNLDSKILKLEEIKSHFQFKWAKFTLPLIFSGLTSFLLFLITIINHLLKSHNQLDFNHNFFKYFVFLVLTFIQILFKENYFLFYLFAIAVAWELYQLSTNYSQINWSVLDKLSGVVYCIGLLNMLLSFSNSFIVSEDTIMRFFLFSFLLIKTLQSILSLFIENYSIKSKKFDRTSQQLKFNFKSYSKKLMIFILISFAVGSFFLHLGMKYKICREEQRQWCSFNSDVNDQFLRFALFFIPFLIVLHRFWLRHCGNLNSTDFNVILIKFLLPFSGICLFVFHSVQLPNQSSAFSEIADMVQFVFPKIIWISSFIVLLFITLRPLLMLYQYSFNTNGSIDIPNLLKRLTHSHSEERSIVVHGLATVYSSAIFTGLLSTCIFVSVFLKLQFVVGIVSTIGVLFSYSILVNTSLKFDEKNILNSFSKSEMSIFMVILTQYGFFATGHQTTIANIPWYSVFVGWKNDHFTKVIPAVMLNINLFSAQIVITLFGLLLPLLLLLISLSPVKFFGNKFVNKNSDDNTNSSINCGDFHLFKTDFECHRFRKWFQTYYIFYLLYHSIVTFCVILSASYSRRHLMAWKIFVPKMIYSVLNLLVVYIMALLSYLIIMRIHQLAIRWRSKNI